MSTAEERLKALEKELKATKEALELEKIARSIDVKKVGEAFHILHTPESTKWKEAGLRLQGEFVTEQVNLDHLWAVGTPEECFKIIA